MGINTFPKPLEELNYANFNVISHCEIHRGHQANQRYSFSSQNFSRRDNVDSFMQSSAGKEIEIRTALSSPFHDGLTPDSRKIQREITSVDFWKVNLYL